MEPRFGYDDLMDLLKKTELMPDDPEETMEAWNIDVEGLIKFLYDGAFLERSDIMMLLAEPKKIFVQFMLVGFTFGYQVAQEQETRKQV